MEKLNIILCDDERIERVLIRKQLDKYMETTHMQPVITECSSAEEFLQKISDIAADIVLLDIYMWTPWKKDFLSFPKESAKSSK